MQYSIFPQTKNDPLQEPMFFGQGVNVSRYDQQRHAIFEQLIERQLSFFGDLMRLMFLVIALILPSFLPLLSTFF